MAGCNSWWCFTTDRGNRAVDLSYMNLMLHSVSNPRIEKRDSVSKDYNEEGKYNLILANPPFKGTLNKENITMKQTFRVAKKAQTSPIKL